MIEYSEFGIFAKPFLHNGLMFYSRRFMEGDVAVFPSPVAFAGDCPTLPIVVKGSLKLTNRDNPGVEMIVQAGPGKIFQGNLLPGIYDMVCLEDDTIYSCLAQYDFTLPPNDNAMKTDWQTEVVAGLVVSDGLDSVTYSEITKVVVCMTGSITVITGDNEELTLTPSEAYFLKENEEVFIVSADGEPAEFGYLKDQS